jgi:hypothetical protein
MMRVKMRSLNYAFSFLETPCQIIRNQGINTDTGPIHNSFWGAALFMIKLIIREGWQRVIPALRGVVVNALLLCRSV